MYVNLSSLEEEKGQKLVIVVLSDTETNGLPCQAEPHILLLGKLP